VVTAINATIQETQPPKNAGVPQKSSPMKYSILFLKKNGGKLVFVKIVWRSLR